MKHGDMKNRFRSDALLYLNHIMLEIRIRNADELKPVSHITVMVPAVPAVVSKDYVGPWALYLPA